jgi:subtilase family serine protease
MRTARVAFVVVAILFSCSAAFAAAGKVHPLSIVAAKADAVTDATAHFGCELRSFTSTRLACYGPDAIRAAYGVKHLIEAGINGKGQTIVIIDAFGSPTAAADLATFDALFGIPAPQSFTQIHMPGSTPFDYTDNNQLGWAEEVSLDVQWAHAIAPGAKIIVVAAVDNSDAAILDAQNYAIDHKLGFIISESFGESEYALLQDGAEGRKILSDNEKSYRRARRAHISVLVSAGDNGAATTDINGDVLPFAAADYPASSPNVTTVGGTNLFFGTPDHADPNGTYQREVVWNDGFGAGGGGISGTFKLPEYQEDGLSKSVRKSLKGFRGYPDVAYNGGVEGGVLVYLGFLDTAFGPGNNGFYIFGGTSAGAPQWAAIAALGNQLGGRPMGFLNTRLYDLGRIRALQFLMHDITVGDNSFAGVTGFAAAPGWDLATGWGTPDEGLVFSLIACRDDDFDDRDDDGQDGHGK